MTYLFKSKASGDVLMLGASGDQLLRIIGKEPATKGIVEPAAMPAAIKAIEEAVAQEEAHQPRAEEVDAEIDRAASHGEDVTLRQRAWPLLEMMRAAHSAAKEIVWGVGCSPSATDASAARPCYSRPISSSTSKTTTTRPSTPLGA
jgi:hypothetical protein